MASALADRVTCKSATCSTKSLLRPNSRVATITRSPVEARRTVRQGASSRDGPNWVLDEPKRLWEIGSRYW
jgi:hypothetical protein